MTGVFVTYLKEWHTVLLVTKFLYKLVNLSALNCLNAGELLEALISGGGEEQHQLGHLVTERSPVGH